MAPYALLTDLEKKLPQSKILNLAHDPELGGTKDIADAAVVANIDQALTDATELVDTYVASVHTVPLSAPVAPRLVTCTCVLAAYYLYARRNYSHENNPFGDQYDKEIAWLKLLAKGDVHVNFGTALAPDHERSSRVRTNASEDDNPKEYDTEDMPY